MIFILNKRIIRSNEKQKNSNIYFHERNTSDFKEENAQLKNLFYTSIERKKKKIAASFRDSRKLKVKSIQISLHLNLFLYSILEIKLSSEILTT